MYVSVGLEDDGREARCERGEQGVWNVIREPRGEAEICACASPRVCGAPVYRVSDFVEN